MSIDTKTAGRVAKLARIKVEEADLPALAQEFTNILGFIEQLNEVDVEGVEPMTSVTPQRYAAPRIAALILPSRPGGVVTTRRPTPAIFAGSASINMVDTSGAVPPGI